MAALPAEPPPMWQTQTHPDLQVSKDSLHGVAQMSRIVADSAYAQALVFMHQNVVTTLGIMDSKLE